MKFWQRLMLRKVLKFKSLLIDKKYKIEPAFELGRIQYYQFSNILDMPASRGLSVMAIYQEFDMKLNKEYIQKHVEATNYILNGGAKKEIDLNALRQINQNLLERSNLLALPDYCYKLASVLFFDAEESTYIYDHKYNEEKIKRWKKNPETLSFFLTRPLKDYLPFSGLPKSNVLTYLNMAEKISEIHLDDLHLVLSKKE